MIYLIYSLGINTDIKEDCILDSMINGEFNEFEPIKMLKIGYTGDDEKTFKSRFIAYKLHNPGCKILCIIPELTEEDEKKLHQKFKDYKYLDYGNEWFEYKEEIIEYFEKLKNDPKLIDELEMKKVLKYSPCSGIGKEESLRIRKELRVYIYKVLTSKKYITDTKEVDDIITELFHHGKKEITDIDDYIRINFGEEVLEDYRIRFNRLSGFSETISSLINTYLFSTMKDKYNFLCRGEFTKFLEEEKELFLSFIPDYDVVKSDFLVLGPSRLMGLCYNRTLIDEALSKLVLDTDKLVYNIFSEFSVGDVVPAIVAKKTLTRIYSELGSTRTVVGSTISEYFEVRETAVRRDLDGSGVKKRVKAYELLQPKEQYQELYNQVKGGIN